MLETLYEIQSCLLKEQPQEGSNVREALDKVDQLIDEVQSEQ